MAIIPKRLTQEYYSDIPKSLEKNPITFDISRKTNVEAIKESLRNLILTRKGERLFNPRLGCGIRDLLFDNMGPDTVIVAKEMIKNTIETYEPRCILNDINVLSSNNGDLSITILFNVINIETPIQYTVTLERAR